MSENLLETLVSHERQYSRLMFLLKGPGYNIMRRQRRLCQEYMKPFHYTNQGVGDFVKVSKRYLESFDSIDTFGAAGISTRS